MRGALAALLSVSLGCSALGDDTVPIDSGTVSDGPEVAGYAAWDRAVADVGSGDFVAVADCAVDDPVAPCAAPRVEGVIAVDSFTVAEGVTVSTSTPVVVIARTISIEGTFDASGVSPSCALPPAPAGFGGLGGPGRQPGGDGGPPAGRTSSYPGPDARPAPTLLLPGCRGGDGGVGVGMVGLPGRGGLGGSAVHLIATESLSISGQVRADGSGGLGGGSGVGGGGGGGGGAGGMIVVDSPLIELVEGGSLSAVGAGGGAGGASGNDGGSAVDCGGASESSGEGGSGGDGCGTIPIDGGGGTGTDSAGGGGGGGGKGAIYFHGSEPRTDGSGSTDPGLEEAPPYGS